MSVEQPLFDRRISLLGLDVASFFVLLFCANLTRAAEASGAHFQENCLAGAGHKECVVQVGSTAQLLAALETTASGAVIELAPGTYTNVSIGNINVPDRGVTIESANTSDQAVIAGLTLSNVGGVTFQNLQLSTVGARNPNYGVMVSHSKNITFRADSFHGSLDNDCHNDISGLNIANTENVKVINSEFQQLKIGITQTNNSELLIENNSFHDIRVDGIDGGVKSSDVTISGNIFTNFYPEGQVGGTGDHADAIQFWTAGATSGSQNITITDNVFVRGAGSYIQGPFMGDEGNVGYSNVKIVGNYIIGGEYNGIAVANVTGLVVQNNVVAGYAGMTSWIRASRSSGVVSGNRANTYMFRDDAGLAQSSNRTIGYVPDGGKALLKAWIAANPSAATELSDALQSRSGRSQSSGTVSQTRPPTD